VATARNGIDGLLAARRHRPAVVIATERLTRLSGSALIEILRHECPAMAAVLLTRAGDDVTEDTATDRAVYVLSTHAAVQELRALLRGLIGLQRDMRRR